MHAVADTGVPFAVVLANGRPLVTSAWIDRAPAVLEAWHLGLEAAPAIARILTGAVNPAGRLPMSFPRSVGQVPVHYDHENTGRPATTGGSMQPLSHDIGLQGPANVAGVVHLQVPRPAAGAAVRLRVTGSATRPSPTGRRSCPGRSCPWTSCAAGRRWRSPSR